VRSTRLLLPLGSASESSASWWPFFTSMGARATLWRNSDRGSRSRSVWLAVALSTSTAPVLQPARALFS
jgi:hypothetical protein